MPASLQMRLSTVTVETMADTADRYNLNLFLKSRLLQRAIYGDNDIDDQTCV